MTCGNPESAALGAHTQSSAASSMRPAPKPTKATAATATSAAVEEALAAWVARQPLQSIEAEP